jgi:hypothetical protein
MPVTEIQADARISAGGVFVPPTDTLGTISGAALQWPIDMHFGGTIDRRLHFKRPLPVKVYKQDGTYVVRCEEIDQFGYGPDMSEALDDFGSTVSEMYFYLADQFKEGNLADSLIQQFAILQSFIERRGINPGNA